MPSKPRAITNTARAGHHSTPANAPFHGEEQPFHRRTGQLGADPPSVVQLGIRQHQWPCGPGEEGACDVVDHSGSYGWLGEKGECYRQPPIACVANHSAKDQGGIPQPMAQRGKIQKYRQTQQRHHKGHKGHLQEAERKRRAATLRGTPQRTKGGASQPGNAGHFQPSNIPPRRQGKSSKRTGPIPLHPLAAERQGGGPEKWTQVDRGVKPPWEGDASHGFNPTGARPVLLEMSIERNQSDSKGASLRGFAP
jgi:hypothetical protein